MKISTALVAGYLICAALTLAESTQNLDAIRQDPILFVTRQQYRPDHHNTATFFPKALHEYNDGAFTPGGALKLLHLKGSPRVTTLLSTTEGVIRDPEVHFSGQRIVFSMRRNVEDSYHIYEIQADGTGLRQLTKAKDVDDLDPLYLPDDSIVFSSTREPKYCMCNRHIMANLYRMNADGANIHQIGKSTLFEGHSSLMPDGRILYDRWEYVDRNFGDAQGLWTSNPDGTGHAVYWGNNTPSPGAVLEGRIIPGTELVLCNFSSCHDRPWGALAIVDRRLGLDGRSPVVRTWPADAVSLVRDEGWQIFDAFTGIKAKYEDPFPVDSSHFLCSRMTGKGEEMGIYLLDLAGNETLVHAEAPGCFDPMPLRPQTRPPVIPERRDYQGGKGTFFVTDVYQGLGMDAIPRGTIKALRVVESPEKRTWTRTSWNGQGQEAPAMNWHDFNNKRILGVVPVEEDGSASFEVPADTFVYFQLLDENGMMVQSMRSGTIAQSGETTGCVGCHEDRRSAPQGLSANSPKALRRAPSRLDGWYGPARLFNYLAEVQPVLDRHCVECHDHGKKGGDKLLLCGDRDLVFNTSYNELWRKKLIAAIGAGPSDNKSARSWGSYPSKMIQMLRSGHKDVQLTREEFDRLATWIDLNAPYYPSYASANPANLAGRAPLNDAQLQRLEELTKIPLRGQADHGNNRGPQVSFERPALSPCLKGLTDPTSEAYREALKIIQDGAQYQARHPEADMPGFEACEMDQWREQKYTQRQLAEQRRRNAITQGTKVYDTD